MYQLLYIILALISSIGCQPPSSSTENQSIPLNENYRFPYRLDAPDHSYNLKNELQEISGIAFTPDYKLLGAIQDEKGKFYFLDKQTGTILAEKKFHKKGDYEDVAFAESVIYIVKSTGTLYRLEKMEADTFVMQKIKNKVLGKENDVEGLCYDKANNQLLLACKGQAAKGDEYKFKKGIYAFDLASQQFSEKPIYTISLEEIQHHLQTSKTVKVLEKFSDFFQPDQTSLTFSPSAIAIHPMTQNKYVLSSRGKVLIVLNPAGAIIHIEKLTKKVHKQPEGLAFEPDGTIYISNEGKGGVANIKRFLMR